MISLIDKGMRVAQALKTALDIFENNVKKI